MNLLHLLREHLWNTYYGLDTPDKLHFVILRIAKWRLYNSYSQKPTICWERPQGWIVETQT